MPIGLGNAIRWLKYEISTVDIDEAEADVSYRASPWTAEALTADQA